MPEDLKPRKQRNKRLQRWSDPQIDLRQRQAPLIIHRGQQILKNGEGNVQILRECDFLIVGVSP